MGNFDSLNLLLDYGADLANKKHNHKMSCLDEIVRNDNVDLLECVYPLFINHLAKRNLKEAGSFSLLHLAAGNTGSKCLKYLLELGGEFVNQICNEQDRATPLHFAILANNYDNAKLLLKFLANPNAKDSLGNTPMHFAVAAKNLSMVRMLDEYAANATHKNIDGICPIDVSITEDLKDIKLHFIAQ
jgi:ankyrin repeat protein